jgi:transposase-like protein
MRYSQSEKMQIILLVAESPLSVKQTLRELNINRSTFYQWYRRYQEGGLDALANRYRPPRQFWNAIPSWEKQRVVETALEYPEKSPRELAWYITDTRGYYISESSVYKILKAMIWLPALYTQLYRLRTSSPTRSRLQMNCGRRTLAGSRLFTRAGTICAPFSTIIQDISRHGSYALACPPKRSREPLMQPLNLAALAISQ